MIISLPMKTILTIQIISLAISVSAQSLTSIESAEFNPAGHQFLISNQNNLIVVNENGVPTSSLPIAVGYGMEVMGSYLFVISGNSVNCYDINTSTEISSVTISGAQFLNGMASDGLARIWVTDFAAKKIHEIDFSDLQNPIANVIVNNTVSTPNGICYDEINNRLVFVSWGNSAPIKAVSLDDYSVTTILTNSGVGNIDGIDNDAYGNFFIASWSPNRITQYNNDFTVSQTITVSGGLNSPADIAYAEEIDTLIIPNSGNNTVRFVGFSAPVSINEMSSSNSLQVYPNPSSDLLVCDFELSTQEKTYASLFDIQGKKVIDLWNGQLPGGKNKLILDMGEVAPGIYSLNIVSETMDFTREIVVQR